MEQFAVRSHERALQAQREGRFDREIVPSSGVSADEGPREPNWEKIRSLPHVGRGRAAHRCGIEPDLRRVGRDPDRERGRAAHSWPHAPRARSITCRCAAPTRSGCSPRRYRRPRTRWRRTGLTHRRHRSGRDQRGVRLGRARVGRRDRRRSGARQRQRRRDRARPSARRHRCPADDHVAARARAHGGRYGLQTMCEGGGQANVTIIERLVMDTAGQPLDFTGRVAFSSPVGRSGIGFAIARPFARRARMSWCVRATRPINCLLLRDDGFIRRRRRARAGAGAAAVECRLPSGTAGWTCWSNNAGGSPSADAATVSPRFVEKIVALNLLAPFYVAQAANALMQQQESGGIDSQHRQRGRARVQPGRPRRTRAAKAGLLQLTRALALEWAPRVRVNHITGGLIRTENATEVLRRRRRCSCRAHHPDAAAGGAIRHRRGVPVSSRRRWLRTSPARISRARRRRGSSPLPRRRRAALIEVRQRRL